MMEQVRLCALWPFQNHDRMNDLNMVYSRAFERRPLGRGEAETLIGVYVVGCNPSRLLRRSARSIPSLTSPRPPTNCRSLHYSAGKFRNLMENKSCRRSCHSEVFLKIVFPLLFRRQYSPWSSNKLKVHISLRQYQS